jgi:hypothetical protein
MCCSIILILSIHISSNRAVRLTFYTASCDNLTNLFTKFLPHATFSKCVRILVCVKLRDLYALEEVFS